MVSGPTISWQIQGEKLEKGKILISCAPKFLENLKYKNG